MDAKQTTLTQQLNSSSGSLELVLSAVLFGVIGLWLDSKVGTTPVFMLVFTLVGFVGAGISVFYRYRHDIERLEAERDSSKAEALVLEQSLAAARSRVRVTRLEL